MCPFQRVNFEPFKASLPMCDYTKDLCTFCVHGNQKTYNEAIKQKENDNK